MMTKTQERILDFLLKHSGEQPTIRGIARGINKSYTLTYNNLSVLENEKIIKKKNVPPAQLVMISETAPSDILIGIEQGIKTEFLKKHPWAELMLEDILSNAETPFFTVIVFGSYAKEKHTQKSDIDLLIITPSKDQVNGIQAVVKRTYTKIKKSIVVVDANNFIDMLSKPTVFNVGNEARKNHIILYGAEQYYQLIKKADNQ